MHLLGGPPFFRRSFCPLSSYMFIKYILTSENSFWNDPLLVPLLWTRLALTFFSSAGPPFHDFSMADILCREQKG